MSWQEPKNNGQKNEQGPPDLDELLKKFSHKISQLFGKKNSSSATPTEPKSLGIGFGVILAVVLLIWALSGVFIVSPAEQGVVLLFGKYQRTVGSGPHWIPRFFESETTVNVQKISTYSYDAPMLTQDQNIVDVSVAVQYRIINPRDYLFNVVNPTMSLQQATASALRQVIGQTTLDAILTTGRAEVRDSVSQQLTKILSIYNAGIVITDVALQPAKAPEQVKNAFDDAIKAQEDEQRFKNQAEAYAMGVVPIAQGKAKRIMQEAQAYKQQIVLQAQADVARFLAILPVYQASPAVTRDRLYISTLQGILQRSQKVFVDTSKSNNLLYLPLDKLMEQNKSITTANVESITQSLARTGDLSTNDAAIPTNLGVVRPGRFDANSNDSGR
jgi:membrane protease subunit HflK